MLFSKWVGTMGKVVTNEAIHQLMKSLPRLDLLGDISADLEDRTRAILGLLFRDVVPAVEVVPSDVTTCPNCGLPNESIRSPYCSEHCREVSAFIRQLRNGIENDLSGDSERQAAMGQMLWYLLGGGLPRRVAMVPEKAIQKVLERENRKCEDCGGIATTIDHSRTACNRPINLRAVCQACCRVRNYEDGDFRKSAAFLQSLHEISIRVQNPIAVRCCDDAESWNWREFLRGRKFR